MTLKQFFVTVLVSAIVSCGVSYGISGITPGVLIAGLVTNTVKERVDSTGFQSAIDEACEKNPKLYRCMLKR